MKVMTTARAAQPRRPGGFRPFDGAVARVAVDNDHLVDAEAPQGFDQRPDRSLFVKAGNDDPNDGLGVAEPHASQAPA
jgi:hypothetical protein